MNSEIIKRLIMIRKALELKQGVFAQILGVPQTTLSTIEHGKSPLQERYIKLICLTFNVNETWLRSGEGEMFNKEKEISSCKQKLLDTFDKLSPRARAILLEYAEKILQDEMVIRSNPAAPA
jgi:transcriptional regulator with XRE-family HTH domain